MKDCALRGADAPYGTGRGEEKMDSLEPEPTPFANTYCEFKPTVTQQAFLDQGKKQEVFFGGAAGGGKSVALLMAATEHLKTPGYSALIIRKDFSRLELAGGLIPRSHEWFSQTPATWNASRRQWLFPVPNKPELPPGAIMFGYLSRPLDKFSYATSELQYIAFDE